MSDVMLCGILRMPPELWEGELSLMQIQSAAKEAATELERRADEIERLQGLLENSGMTVRELLANDERLRAALDRVGRHLHATGEIRRYAGDALGRVYNADGETVSADVQQRCDCKSEAGCDAPSAYRPGCVRYVQPVAPVQSPPDRFEEAVRRMNELTDGMEVDPDDEIADELADVQTPPPRVFQATVDRDGDELMLIFEWEVLDAMGWKVGDEVRWVLNLKDGEVRIEKVGGDKP